MRIFGARVALGLTALAIVLAALGSLEVLAQGSPFGAGRPPPAPPPAADGITGWIIARQAEFYRQFSGVIRAAKADGSALWTLFGISFLYGVFHAAGPGHGKAVISSYLVANDETWRRGIALSFASAMLQAVVAVLIVGIGAVLLGATSRLMCRTADIIEMVSYALIAAVGGWLLLIKGRGLVRALGALRRKPAVANGATTPHQHHAGHDHRHPEPHNHHHERTDDHSGHSHGPEPQHLAGPGGWRRGFAAVLAVGLRPCSGAIVVLVFALAQGIFWAGVGATFVMGLGTAVAVAAIATLAVGARSLAERITATRSSIGTLALRGIEVAAACVVLALGLLLLAGYMVTERITFC
jgi:nickel/cobalt exporter